MMLFIIIDNLKEASKNFFKIVSVDIPETLSV